jgi:hypothetical protein
MGTNNYSKDVYDLNYVLIFAYDKLQSGDLKRSELDLETSRFKINPNFWKFVLEYSHVIHETFEDKRYSYNWLVNIRPNIHMAHNLICEYESYLRREQEDMKLAISLEHAAMQSDVTVAELKVFKFLNWCYLNLRNEKIFTDELVNSLYQKFNCTYDVLVALIALNVVIKTKNNVTLKWVHPTIMPTVDLVKRVINEMVTAQYDINTTKTVAPKVYSDTVLFPKKRWTPEMEMLLTKLHAEGRSLSEIGKALDRTSAAIQTRLSERKYRKCAYKKQILGFDIMPDTINIPTEKLPSKGIHYPDIKNVAIHPSSEYIKKVADSVKLSLHSAYGQFGPASDGTLTIDQDEAIRKLFPLNVDCESTSKAMFEQDKIDSAKNIRSNTWTAQQDADLIECIQDKVPVDDIVELLSNRTRQAVLNRVCLLNASRKPDNQLRLAGLKRQPKYEQVVDMGIVVEGKHRRTGDKEWLPLDQPLPKKENKIVKFLKTLFS